MATEITGSRVTSPGGGYARTNQGSDSIVGAAVGQIGGAIERLFERQASDKLANFTLDTEKYLLDLRARGVLPAEREGLLNKYFKESGQNGEDILKVRASIKVNKGKVHRINGELREFDADTDRIVGSEAKMLHSSNNFDKELAATQTHMPNSVKAYETGIMANIHNGGDTDRMTAMHAQINERVLNVGTLMERINNYRVFNGTANIGVLADAEANQTVRAGEWKRTVEEAANTLMNPTLAGAYDEEGNFITRNAMEGVMRAFKQDVLSKAGTTFQQQTGMSMDDIVKHLDKQVTSMEKFGEGVLDKGIRGVANQRNLINVQAIQIEEVFEEADARKALLLRDPAMHKLLIQDKIGLTRAVAQTVTSLGTLGELGTVRDIMEKYIDPVTTEIAWDGIAAIASITEAPELDKRFTRLSNSIAMFNNPPLQRAFAREFRKKIAQIKTSNPDKAEEYEERISDWVADGDKRRLLPKATQ